MINYSTMQGQTKADFASEIITTFDSLTGLLSGLEDWSSLLSILLQVWSARMGRNNCGVHNLLPRIHAEIKSCNSCSL